MHKQVRELLDEELDSAFRRYIGLEPYLNEIHHQVMAAFIRGLP